MAEAGAPGFYRSVLEKRVVGERCIEKQIKAG